MNKNLISLGTLENEGYTVKQHNGRIMVIKGSIMTLCGTRKANYVYLLDGWLKAGKANVSVEERENLTQVWHKRVGHINETGYTN